jgi:hypothetical protein
MEKMIEMLTNAQDNNAVVAISCINPAFYLTMRVIPNLLIINDSWYEITDKREGNDKKVSFTMPSKVSFDPDLNEFSFESKGSIIIITDDRRCQ